MPVNTAQARARQACPSARAADEVIHWLSPLGRAVVPSSEAAIFIRTQGVLRTMRLKNPMLSSKGFFAPGPPRPQPCGSGRCKALSGYQRVGVGKRTTTLRCQLQSKSVAAWARAALVGAGLQRHIGGGPAQSFPEPRHRKQCMISACGPPPAGEAWPNISPFGRRDDAAHARVGVGKKSAWWSPKRAW